MFDLCKNIHFYINRSHMKKLNYKLTTNKNKNIKNYCGRYILNFLENQRHHNRFIIQLRNTIIETRKFRSFNGV